MLEEDKAQLYYIRNSLHNAAFNDVVQNCDSVFEVRKPACVDGTEGNHSGKIIGMGYDNEDKLISLKEDIEGRIRKSNLKIDEIIEESNSQQKEELKKAYYIRYKMKLVTNAAGNITVSTKPAFIKNTVTGTDLKYDLLSLVNLLIKLGANSEAADIKQFVKTINEVKYYVRSKEAGTATRIYYMNEFGEKKQVNVNNILLINSLDPGSELINSAERARERKVRSDVSKELFSYTDLSLPKGVNNEITIYEANEKYIGRTGRRKDSDDISRRDEE